MRQVLRLSFTKQACITFFLSQPKVNLTEDAYLQHCLYCSNGDISEEEKDRVRDEFIKDKDQRLFHLTRVLNREELFTFIAITSDFDDQKTKK